MHKNIIPYPNAEDWRKLTRRLAKNPGKFPLALLYAAEEIAHLRRQCIRHGHIPEPRRDPGNLCIQWPESKYGKGDPIPFKPSSDQS